LVESATKATVAHAYGVSESEVTNVTATESRRLVQAALRKLTGTWTVTFKIINVAASQVATFEAKSFQLGANTTNFTATLTLKLKDFGVAQTDLDSIAMQSFSVVSDTATTTTFFVVPTGGTSLPETAFLSLILISVLTFIM